MLTPRRIPPLARVIAKRSSWTVGAQFAALTPAVLFAQNAATAPAPTDVSGFPEPVWGALLTVMVSGALGAFAADLVTDAGRVERLRRDGTGWVLGFIGKMVVGSVAALILLTLNPPGESWLTLIGTGLAAGVGGEAILLAIVSARRTQQAENERDAAKQNAVRIANDAAEKIESFRVLAVAAGGVRGSGAGVGLESVRKAAPGDPSPASSAEDAQSLLDIFAERSKAEILATARVDTRSDITSTIRSILVLRLEDEDVDTRKLKDMGGNDAGIRRRIAHDIAQRWPNLNPAFVEEDVTGDSTLASLSREVRRRSP